MPEQNLGVPGHSGTYPSYVPDPNVNFPENCIISNTSAPLIIVFQLGLLLHGYLYGTEVHETGAYSPLI